MDARGALGRGARTLRRLGVPPCPLNRAAIRLAAAGFCYTEPCLCGAPPPPPPANGGDAAPNRRGPLPALLLTFPLWQFRAPDTELDRPALANADAATLFDPPSLQPYSRRGWTLGRRLPPAHEAPIGGGAPSPLDGGGSGAEDEGTRWLGAGAGGGGVWGGGGGGGQRGGDVSFWLAPSVCETVEFVNWEPARIWALSEAEKRQLEASHNRPCNAL